MGGYISKGPRSDPEAALSGSPLNTSGNAGVIIINSTWKHGGRVYGPHMNMSKAERAKIQIAGEPIVELDYTAIHPSLLYAYIGLPIPDDCYDVLIHEHDHVVSPERHHVKLALMILINASTLQSAALTLAARIENLDREFDGFEALGDDEKPSLKHIKYAHQLIRAVKQHHKPIQDYFHTGAGVWLQNIDAQIAEAVWWAMCQRGIMVLPVHDSFIAQEQYAGMLE